MKKKPVYLIAVATLMLAIGLGWQLSRTTGPEAVEDPAPAPETTAVESPDPSRLDRLLNDFPPRLAPEEVERRLEQIRITGKDQSQALVQFLTSGQDQTLDSRFELGPGGEIQLAPTLRSWVLGLLAEQNLEAANAYARAHIFTNKDSADEWAVALRNLRRADTEPAVFQELKARVFEMLNHAPWQEAAGSGYLHSFDFLVYLGDHDAFGLAADLHENHATKSVGYASYMALDRLVLNDPQRFLPLLAKQPLLVKQGASRGALLARADVRRAPQRDALDHYLNQDGPNDDEANAFSRNFPNFSQFGGYRLATGETGFRFSLEDMAAIDLAALEWLEDRGAPAPVFAEPLAERIAALQGVREEIMTELNEGRLRELTRAAPTQPEDPNHD